MRYVYLVLLFLCVLTVSVFGFRGTRFNTPPLDVFPEWAFPGMKYQPKYRPQAGSAFFADGRADRPLPANVVARGDLRASDAVNLGRSSATEFVRGFPEGVTIDVRAMAHGRERYDIYCAICHGAVGDGNGMTKRYGMAPANLLDARARALPEGEIFNVITNGTANRNMMPYADKLTPEERWQVIAYVRALQRAAAGTAADIADDAARKELGLQ